MKQEKQITVDDYIKITIIIITILAIGKQALDFEPEFLASHCDSQAS